MKAGLYELYTRLADGQRHNGAELAEELGITRAAVWKRMEVLRSMGLDVGGTAGDGYRLPRPIELLDAGRIRERLKCREVTVETAGAVDSTNARLIEAGSPHATALVAELQTAGRGRRGRGWLSPPGSGLYLSLGWRFESGLAGLAPLSLVVGMTVAQAIVHISAVAVRVKWPNDLFVGSAKLGGCLVEISGAAEGPCRAVAGVGINLHHSGAAETIDQPWTSLSDHGPVPGRNALAAKLIDGLASALARFDREGFEPFLAQWGEVDALAGRRVRILRDRQPELTGIADGIDRQGRLLLSGRDGTLAVSSGEVSVRAG